MVDRDQGTVVLDAGAVIGLARGDRRLRARLTAIRADGESIVIPMVVVTETTRGNGPRDAAVNLVIGHCAPLHQLSEATARTAGVLLRRTRSSNTIDALVVAEAVGRAPCVVLTSDPDDLAPLTAASGARVLIRPI